MKNVNETNGKVIVNNNLKRGNKTMKKSNGNKNLNKAKAAASDEYYTLLTDIEKELYLYRDQLRGKVIYLNCDDHEKSNFWLYFRLKFNELGLKKVIATHYSLFGEAYKLELLATYRSGEPKTLIKTPIEGNGDFRSPASIELLRQADIVITNPPFSLFREYVAQLVEHGKKFLILGNKNAVDYKVIFPLVKAGKIKIGRYSPKSFIVPAGKEHDFIDESGNRVSNKINGLSKWWTNLETPFKVYDLVFAYDYTPEKYPELDNYHAISVDRFVDIPNDYKGVMAVPITCFERLDPEVFEVIGCATKDGAPDCYREECGYGFRAQLNGKVKYARLFIQRKEVK
jgi:hypothetical protein